MRVPELITSILPISGSKISYNSGHNSVTVTYTSDISLIYEEIRVTKGSTGYAIGQGTKVHVDGGSIAANVSHTCTFEVNSINFSEGDGLYTISLYVKNAIDGTWNEIHYFITVGNEAFITYDPAELVTTTHQPIPDDAYEAYLTVNDEDVVTVDDYDFTVIPVAVIA